MQSRQVRSARPKVNVTIREIVPADAAAAARLSTELGYPVSAAVMDGRIRRLSSLTDHTVFVACIDDSVVAWIDVGAVYHLQAEPSCEIGGFVVSDGFRSAGIGHELIARGEEWARGRGFTRMMVRSQIAREAAHRFYIREGYERTKTSAVFTKSL